MQNMQLTIPCLHKIIQLLQQQKKHSLQKVLAKAQAHFPKFLLVSLTKKKRPQNLKPFKIPSLNLCKEDFSDLHKGHTIGEGTFGKCIAGTYKGIPTAYKIFKTSNYRDVHAEADVLLRIPSHPGIAMHCCQQKEYPVNHLLVQIHMCVVPFELPGENCYLSGLWNLELPHKVEIDFLESVAELFFYLVSFHCRSDSYMVSYNCNLWAAKIFLALTQR